MTAMLPWWSGLPRSYAVQTDCDRCEPSAMCHGPAKPVATKIGARTVREMRRLTIEVARPVRTARELGDRSWVRVRGSGDLANAPAPSAYEAALLPGPR